MSGQVHDAIVPIGNAFRFPFRCGSQVDKYRYNHFPMRMLVLCSSQWPYYELRQNQRNQTSVAT